MAFAGHLIRRAAKTVVVGIPSTSHTVTTNQGDVHVEVAVLSTHNGTAVVVAWPPPWVIAAMMLASAPP